jgi:hypothetical protein
LWFIGTIGKVLCFKTNGTTLAVNRLFFACYIPFQTIGRINLQSGFGGVNFHGAAACIICYAGCQTSIVALRIEHPRVVITAGNIQLQTVNINAVANVAG